MAAVQAKLQTSSRDFQKLEAGEWPLELSCGSLDADRQR